MRGGARDGAGRKKGQVSKETEQRKAVALKALADGISPLDYMLKILRDEGQDQSARFQAAKEAAPYVHPRLAAVAVSGNEDNPIRHEVTHIDADTFTGRVASLASRVAEDAGASEADARN